MIADGLMTPVYAPDLAPLAQSPTTPGYGPDMPTPTTTTKGEKPKMISLQIKDDRRCCTSRNGTYATSFFCQWYLLFLRTMLCLRRDRSLALMRFFIHFCIALLVGTLYFNIGNNAAMMYNNFRYIVLSQMFLLFTSFCSMTILCKWTNQHNLWHFWAGESTRVCLSDFQMNHGKRLKILMFRTIFLYSNSSTWNAHRCTRTF